MTALELAELYGNDDACDVLKRPLDDSLPIVQAAAAAAAAAAPPSAMEATHSLTMHVQQLGTPTRVRPVRFHQPVSIIREAQIQSSHSEPDVYLISGSVYHREMSPGLLVNDAPGAVTNNADVMSPRATVGLLGQSVCGLVPHWSTYISVPHSSRRYFSLVKDYGAGLIDLAPSQSSRFRHTCDMLSPGLIPCQDIAGFVICSTSMDTITEQDTNPGFYPTYFHDARQLIPLAASMRAADVNIAGLETLFNDVETVRLNAVLALCTGTHVLWVDLPSGQLWSMDLRQPRRRNCVQVDAPITGLHYTRWPHVVYASAWGRGYTIALQPFAAVVDVWQTDGISCLSSTRNELVVCAGDKISLYPFPDYGRVSSWSHRAHRSYPDDFRAVAWQLVRGQYARKSILHHLPPDIIDLLLMHLAMVW